MNISILTATWNYNLWDELILFEEYKIFKEVFKESKFNIFTYDKNSCFIKDNVNYINYFPSWIKKYFFTNLKYLWQNIITFYKSDLIIIWWWWLIYDREIQKSKSNLLQWKFRVFLAKLFWKKIIYFAIWINIQEKNYKKIKFLFNGENIKISVRDKKSQEILEKIWVKSTLIYDPVFLLNWNDINKHKNKTVWISIRQGYLKNEKENLKQIILYFSRYWYKIIFLTHSIHKKDAIANDYKFLLNLSKKYKCLITENLNQTLLTYKNLDLLIGMRLHSMILSSLYSIPFIWINYNTKTEELLKILNYKYYLNSKEFNFENFINLFKEIQQKKDIIKFDLNEKTNKIKKQLKFNIINFLDYGLD